ncbi:MAG TPA: hypothetical protein VFM25_07980 [Verrucomicrobiae bacterium]|nr:hypothetical protein [Verrucomicrobiae bacterium]
MSDQIQNGVVRFPGAPSLALTFLFAGAGYALPFLLFPKNFPLNGPTSPEVLNLYFLVAWMGLAHFIFAYEGQTKFLFRTKTSSSAKFIIAIILGGGFLVLLWQSVGLQIFSFLIWIYFIPHFVKAELHFSRTFPQRGADKWVLYWFPALAFAFLTFALFAPVTWTKQGWLLFVIALICVIAGLLGGVFQQLKEPNLSAYALLAFFFIGEGLVWGTYSKYMSPQFRQGVYIFHVAIASFYHYFRSYGFALKKLSANGPANHYILKIFGVNALIVLFGWLVVQNQHWRFPQFIFGIQFFTFWVGLHLISSDLFSWLKKIA